MSALIAPPMLRGPEREQLQQLRDYLFQLHRQISGAMTAMEEGSLTRADAWKPAAATAGTAEDKPATNSRSQHAAALKSLIISTADVIRHEMNQITLDLHDDYLAMSDFGFYRESVKTQFAAAAESVTQQIGYAAEIAAAANAATGDALQSYIVNTNGFIRQGIIRYDGAVPVIGIAIGQDIQTTGTGTKDGREYPVIDTGSAMSTFTAEKLSFYLNGAEVAYVSNNRLFITDAEITGTMRMGNWEISERNGYSIKWIGA